MSETVGAVDADASLLGMDAVRELLRVSRTAAHEVARPAAPLTAFALGLALGARPGSTLADLGAAIRRVEALARGDREAGTARS